MSYSYLKWFITPPSFLYPAFSLLTFRPYPYCSFSPSVPSHPRSNTFPLPLLPSLQPVKKPESQYREFTALGEAFFECCKIRTGDLSNMPETDFPPLLEKKDLDPPLPSTRHAMHRESRWAVSSRGGSRLAGPNKNNWLAQSLKRLKFGWRIVSLSRENSINLGQCNLEVH